MLCPACISALPTTSYQHLEGNEVEKMFWGRVQVDAAFAAYYFAKGSKLQTILHELKYRRNKNIGYYIGELLGRMMADAPRYQNIDLLVPLPLFPKKEFKRGYNQAEILCQGIRKSLHKKVLSGVVVRNRSTETQTKKHRGERWTNVDGSFSVKNPEAITGKHILLVDDVITTGATMEACIQAILSVPGTKVSVAAVAVASS